MRIKPQLKNAYVYCSDSSHKGSYQYYLVLRVLIEAKALGINISQVCDQFLRERIRLEREKLWQQDHAEFIANYNAIVEQEDLPLQEWLIF